MAGRRGFGVHTVPLTGARRGWGNAVAGVVVSRHRVQRTALAVGRRLAMVLRTEHVIHRPDGRIRDKNSYGADGCPPRDQR